MRMSDWSSDVCSSDLPRIQGHDPQAEGEAAGMSARPWYKRYGADFVHGSLGLSLEEKGAYSLCLDLIYDRGGPIPDDDRWLAGVCGVSIRKWKAVRARLIEAGKIIERDGRLSNHSAEKEKIGRAQV